jgi:hypothetical protein
MLIWKVFLILLLSLPFLSLLCWLRFCNSVIKKSHVYSCLVLLGSISILSTRFLLSRPECLCWTYLLQKMRRNWAKDPCRSRFSLQVTFDQPLQSGLSKRFPVISSPKTVDCQTVYFIDRRHSRAELYVFGDPRIQQWVFHTVWT